MLIPKLLVFSYIVLSPFINYKYISFLNTILAKMLFIIIIVGVTFYDLQLAILLTLALLVLVINLNSTRLPKKEHFVPIMTPISEFPQENCATAETAVSEPVSNHLYNLYVDPKIKPYEEYVMQLSPPESVESACGLSPSI